MPTDRERALQIAINAPGWTVELTAAAITRALADADRAGYERARREIGEAFRIYERGEGRAVDAAQSLLDACARESEQAGKREG